MSWFNCKNRFAIVSNFSRISVALAYPVELLTKYFHIHKKRRKKLTNNKWVIYKTRSNYSFKDSWKNLFFVKACCGQLKSLCCKCYSSHLFQFAGYFLCFAFRLTETSIGYFKDWIISRLALPVLFFFPHFFLLERKENIFWRKTFTKQTQIQFFFLFINVFHSFQTSGAQ